MTTITTLTIAVLGIAALLYIVLLIARVASTLVERLQDKECRACPARLRDEEARVTELVVEISRSSVKANIDAVIASWKELEEATREATGEVSTGQVEEEVSEPETLGVEVYGRG